MIFKKRTMTYIACSLSVLFFAGLIWLYIERVFEYDFKSAGLFGVAAVLGFALLFICIYFIMFLFRKIGKPALSKTLEIILIVIIALAGVVLRLSYPDPVSVDVIYKFTSFDLNTIIYLIISVAKLVLTYFVARIAIGRLGGFIALGVSAYLPVFSSEYNIPDKNVFFETGILVLALLFAIWYKRGNNNKLKTVPSNIILGVIIAVCGIAGAYFNSLILLAILLFISMIPTAWKHGYYALSFAILLCGLSLLAIGSLFGNDIFMTHFNKYAAAYYNLVHNFKPTISDTFTNYKDNTINVLYEVYKAYFNDIAVYILLISSFISSIIMYFGKRLSIMPFMIYFMLVSLTDKRMILYMAVFAFAYGFQTLHDLFYKKASLKEKESVEVVSGTVEEPVKNRITYTMLDPMTDEQYDEFLNSLPVPMALIDSQCVIKVIDHSNSETAECWQNRKFRAVVRSLKKYYESEEKSNE